MCGLMNRRRIRAFTLVELLVVIAIIGTLVGLLLPAVQAARESGRRTQCMNGLKQLGLSSQSYHDQKNEVPPARPADGFATWPVFLLPFMEEQNLYDKWDLTKTVDHANNDDTRNVSLSGHFCASRRRPPLLSVSEQGGNKTGAVGDYAAVAGDGITPTGETWTWDTELSNGAIISANPAAQGWSGAVGTSDLGQIRSAVNFAMIRDGLSKTLLIGEKHVHADNQQKGIKQWGDGSIYNGAGDGKTGYNAEGAFRNYMRIGGDNVGIARNSTFDPGAANGNDHFGSFHPGICQFALCDGSVRNLSVTVDANVLRSFCNRNGGASDVQTDY